MIWGGSFDVSKLSTQVPTDAKYLLTFNEPNFGSQANLTPQAAAALWPQIEAFAKSRGLKIVSPAVNYCGGSCNETDPYVWLADFFAACQGCQVDYVAVHWYACYQSALTSYVQKFETQFGKQLWLTEFSCLDGSLPATAANEQTYMTQAVEALEADPIIFRYSWFTGRDTGSPAVNLLGAASGSLTPLGQAYIAASPAK
jgi:O-glycosyl hydrolase